MGKVLQAEGAVSTKALRSEKAWWIYEIERNGIQINFQTSGSYNRFLEGGPSAPHTSLGKGSVGYYWEQGVGYVSMESWVQIPTATFCQGTWSSVLVSNGCVTNFVKTEWLNTALQSQFLWIRNLGMTESGPVLQAVIRKWVSRESPSRWKSKSFYAPIGEMMSLIFAVFYSLELREGIIQRPDDQEAGIHGDVDTQRDRGRDRQRKRQR